MATTPPARRSPSLSQHTGSPVHNSANPPVRLALGELTPNARLASPRNANNNNGDLKKPLRATSPLKHVQTLSPRSGLQRENGSHVVGRKRSYAEIANEDAVLSEPTVAGMVPSPFHNPERSHALTLTSVEVPDEVSSCLAVASD
jgi:hypothetical protein